MITMVMVAVTNCAAAATTATNLMANGGNDAVWMTVLKLESSSENHSKVGGGRNRGDDGDWFLAII